MTNKVFILFNNCIPVTGACRTAICDLIKEDIHLVSNELFGFFSDNILNVEEVSPKLNDDDRKFFFEFIHFLEEKQLGFWCDEELVSSFPPLSQEWDYCSSITNCIIDFGENTQIFLKNIIGQLEELNCHFLQLRFFDSVQEDQLICAMDLIKLSKIKSVELIVKFDNRKDFLTSLILLMNEYTQLSSIFVHSTLDPDFLTNRTNDTNIYFFSEVIDDVAHCGNIDPSYFSINIQMFTESKMFNSCLNRKVSIDRSGQIKNCPSMKDSYGSIANVRLKDVVSTDAFKRIWTVGKDKVNICSQCEFRYVCSDCRAYLEDPSDIYSKPLKCGYNPLTCEWSDWSDNPIKKNAIEFYSKEAR
jgi:SPASM domain peptide maturase of grasp-with-spasm system